MAKYWPVRTKGKYHRAKRRITSIRPGEVKSMGKMFRTKAGKYGCYVYINGKRSHFEEKRR